MRLIWIMLLIAGVVSVLLAEAVAAWPVGLADWGYRKTLAVNATDGATLSSFPMLINITYDAHMDAGYEDLRFYNNCSDDAVELDYWVEEEHLSSYADVWVELTTVNATICMYYGASGKTNTSSITNTFHFADDFNRADNATVGNGWAETETSGCTTSIDAGRAKFLDASAGEAILQQGISALTAGFMRSRIYLAAGAGTHHYSSRLSDGDQLGSILSFEQNSVKTYISTVKTNISTYLNDVWVIAEVRLNATAGLHSTYFNNSLVNSNSAVYQAQSEVDTVYIGTPGTAGHTTYVDWVIVDQYYPYTAYAFGSEESAPAVSAPKYSDIATTPASPQTFPVSNIQFNVTWVDTENNIDKAWLIHNQSGSNVTVMLTNTTDNYSWQMPAMSAGDFFYELSANDTTGLTNTTAMFYFSVAKAATTINISINGTAGADAATNVSYNVSYGNTTNTTLYKSVSNGNLSLTRNSTVISYNSSGDIVQDIDFFGYSTQYYVGSLTHDNYTADTVHIILNVLQADPGLTLSAASWNIDEGDDATVTCANTVGQSMALYRSGINVTNPFTGSLPFGVYNFTCYITDTYNYTPSLITNYLTVSSGGFGCTDNDTWAFRKTITTTAFASGNLTLNFTDLVAEGLVKENMTDVWVNTSLFTSFYNTTYGNYIILQNTTPITSFYVDFGNYLGNETRTEVNVSGTVSAVTGYSEISPYMVLSMLNERTGATLIPPDGNLTISVFCSDGVSSFDVNDTTILVATYEQADSVKATVMYSVTEIYFRNYEVRTEAEYKNIYLVDANDWQVVEMVFHVVDYSGDYSAPLFQVKKYLDGSLRTITEVDTDAEGKAVAFLINGDMYQIFVSQGSSERNIGYMQVETSDTTKTLILGASYSTDTSTGNVSHSLLYDGTTITFSWSDPSAQTTSVDFWVLNSTTKASLYSTSSTNTTSVEFNYVVPVVNATYLVGWALHHSVFGENTTGYQILMIGNSTALEEFPIFDVLTGLGADASMWFAFLFLIPIPIMFDQRRAGIGAIFFVAVCGLLVYWGLYAELVVILPLGLLMAVMIEMKNRREVGA